MNEQHLEELPPEPCPNCGEQDDVWRAHHSGDIRAPECDYWVCGACDFQWGHE